MTALRARRAVAVAICVGLLALTAAAIPAASPTPSDPATDRAFLAFAEQPRRPGNLLARIGRAGRSPSGRPIRLLQVGDPAWPGEVVLLACVRAAECEARDLHPGRLGCPDPGADIYVVPTLDPDGIADRSASRPATGLATRIVERLHPAVVIWARRAPVQRPGLRLAAPPAWLGDAAGARAMALNLPPGGLSSSERERLQRSILRIGREVRSG